MPATHLARLYASEVSNCVVESGISHDDSGQVTHQISARGTSGFQVTNQLRQSKAAKSSWVSRPKCLNKTSGKGRCCDVIRAWPQADGQH